MTLFMAVLPRLALLVACVVLALHGQPALAWACFSAVVVGVGDRRPSPQRATA